MDDTTLTEAQRHIIARSVGRRLFLEGPAGCGKSTVGAHRLLHLLAADIPPDSILILVPQRTLAAPYHQVRRTPGGEATIVTIGGLAQRMVNLFWPPVAEEAGFAHPDRPPTFLTLETAQYHMAHLLRPLLDREHLFETVVIDRHRLYSQILDNLGKAALVGFPLSEIGARLGAAWSGEKEQHRIYAETQQCVNLFREYCLAHNLLDFSLQIELFRDYLWALPTRRAHLLEKYRYLIADNVEELPPVAHDILRDWLPHSRAALLIYDTDAGYRRFLGADPQEGHSLGDLCAERLTLTESFVTTPEMKALETALERPAAQKKAVANPRTALIYETHRYYPQMLDWVADEVGHLIHIEQTPPAEIAILSPFLNDSLRFALVSRLERRGITAHSHRPSRPLRDEPATRSLLTWAAIAHPEWEITPSTFDVTHALMQTIADLDLVRAHLLTAIVYRTSEGFPTLGPFDRLKPEVQERITITLGERYEKLRGWLTAYTAGPRLELDRFLSQILADLLSQEGYRFRRGHPGYRPIADLIESVRKFRRAAGERGIFIGREYLKMVQDGVIAAQYVRAWQQRPEEAVLVAPAYTFLMSNRPVEIQFWLDIGGQGWWERINQPLTHPYVLSRHWPPADRGPAWTDADEVAARNEALRRLLLGLVRRCRRRIYLGISELGEQGYEQRGPLLQTIRRALRRM